MGEVTFQVIRILSLTSVAFVVAITLTPFWTKVLYKYKLGKQIRTEGAPIFASLHKGKEGTPTMGGLLILVSMFVSILLFCRITDERVLLLSAVTLSFAYLGFATITPRSSGAIISDSRRVRNSPLNR